VKIIYLACCFVAFVAEGCKIKASASSFETVIIVFWWNRFGKRSHAYLCLC